MIYFSRFSDNLMLTNIRNYLPDAHYIAQHNSPNTTNLLLPARTI
jgi:hypothetical protein